MEVIREEGITAVRQARLPSLSWVGLAWCGVHQRKMMTIILQTQAEDLTSVVPRSLVGLDAFLHT